MDNKRTYRACAWQFWHAAQTLRSAATSPAGRAQARAVLEELEANAVRLVRARAREAIRSRWPRPALW